METMQAWTKYEYGGPAVLNFEQIERPVVGEGQLLVRVAANSLNAADWRILRGKPFLARLAFGLFKPKVRVLGADFSGTVVACGDRVTKFQVGDRVFGESLRGGAFAEYLAVSQDACAKIPPNVSFEFAAALPMAGVTALQALVTKGALKAGERVLIKAATGGVGHFAVQIAKGNGAVVSAMCAARNADFARSLGADAVVDYKHIHRLYGNYDLFIDAYGDTTFAEFNRLARRGVLVGFTNFRHMLAAMVQAKLSGYSLTEFTAQTRTKDLETLAHLLSLGKIKPRSMNTYSQYELPAAIKKLESRYSTGKIIIRWGDSTPQ